MKPPNVVSKVPHGFTLILGTLFISFGMLACSSGDSGGGGGITAAGTAVSGTASAPGGTVAKAEPASLLKWFASLFVSESRAQAVNGFVGVANVPVLAFNADIQGEPIPHNIAGLPDPVIIAQTTSAANGSFTLNLPTGFTPAINTVVQAATTATPVGIKTAGNAIHAFLIGNPVDVDPATEAALEALVNYMAAPPGPIPTDAFTSSELAQLEALVRAEVAARLSLVGSTTTDTVTNILALAGLQTLIADALAAIDGAGQDPLTILTTALPNGTVSTHYNAMLRAIGGTGTQTWSVVLPGIGVLPVGLTLNNAGLVTGMPTTSGLFNFTVQVSAPPPQVTMKNIRLFVTAGGVPSTAFPLVVSGDQRYLQDQKGVPFPILGRTAWFITSLSETDYKMFIDDTAAKGYNAIEFHVVNHDERGNHPPYDGNGALPFTKRLDGSPWLGHLGYPDPNSQAPDFSQPNETYWTHVDGLLAYAESKGILCFVFPAYTGYQGLAQGWMVEMVANGVDKMTAYGGFIANRYKARGNIVWMLGGDYGTGVNDFKTPPGPDELGVEQAMLAGMKSVGGQASANFSAEWESDSIYTDQADATLRAAGTLQGAYSHGGNVNTYTRNGYGGFDSDGTTPHAVMPTFLLEEPYDEEGPDGNNVNSAATQPVRRYQWWGWLSGIGGYISGNGCVWPFNPPNLSPYPFCQDGWKAHLNTQGAQDMERLNAFVRSIAWFNLVPSGLNGMKILVPSVTPPPVSNGNYVAAAATLDGTLLVAYVPPEHLGPIDIDMTAMSGPTRARWFNPASAAYAAYTVIGTFANTGTRSFTPPGDNGTSFTDWVLLLEKQ
jgi:hypothetical protein